MKKILFIFIFALIGLSSCEEFLDQQPLDIPASPEEIFTKRATADKYMNRVYSFLPQPGQYSAQDVRTNDEVYKYAEPWVPASDEADNGFNHSVNQINNGSWNTGNIPYDKWDVMYRGIREATYFMQNIHMCEDYDDTKIKQYYNEAKVIRAYCYLTLMKMYGPVPILYNADQTNMDDINSDYMKQYLSRTTWDECVKYVCEQLDETLPFLIKNPSQADLGRITPGVALAFKSRTLLLSASQLFNPREPSMFAGWKNKEGQNLIPTAFDQDKWVAAAAAAKAVIDYIPEGGRSYSLVKKYDGGVLNPYKSLYGAFADQWNSTELIFGRAFDDQAWFQRLISRSIHSGCWGGINPTQRIVDAYAWVNTTNPNDPCNGLYPIIGYKDAKGSGNMGVECTSGGAVPIKEPRLVSNPGGPAANADKYFEVVPGETFSASLLGYANNYVHPFDGKSRSIIRMWQNREPRFYIDIAYNALDYYYGISGDGFVPDPKANFITLNHHKGGSGGITNSSHTATGYTQRKFTTRDINPLLQNKAGWRVPNVFPLIRLNEIYLNYVEALIEVGDLNNPDIWKYWNEIRTRAGVPNIENVYPNIKSDQAIARQYLRHERMIELSFEGHRYFDTRRWQIAHITNTVSYGMNIYSTLGSPMGKPFNDKGDATFYKRTISEYGNRVFKKNFYLWPINMTEINRNRNIEQAPGW